MLLIRIAALALAAFCIYLAKAISDDVDARRHQLGRRQLFFYNLGGLTAAVLGPVLIVVALH